ncbi:uncharacterized protein LOC113797644 [Dermatophagoides pteronyssinus]|uniref:uncharacterized protein LOC113797644 n=1 Tax=Dermatophagoides pteronyssinus TaxID=6956 RepID=UPI003F6820EF
MYYPRIIKRNISTQNGISDIFDKCFECLNYYLLRMDYSIIDYRKRHIHWTYRTFKWAVWITIISVILNSIMLTMINRPESVAGLPLSFIDFEETFDIQRTDLIIIHLVITFLMLDYLWFSMFKNILSYNFLVNDLLIKYNDNNLMETRLQEYLIFFFGIIDYCSTLFYRLSAIILTLGYALFIIHVCRLNQNNKMTFLQWLLFLQLWTMFRFRLIYLMGQLFVAMKFVLFAVEFYRIQLIKILKIAKAIFTRTIDFKYTANRRLIWRNFHCEYLTLYLDAWKFDKTMRIIMFAIEMIAKSAIINCSTFYSKQQRMNTTNKGIIVLMGSAYLYTKIIYSYVSLIPFYNQIFTRLIMNWNARIYWYRFSRQKNQQQSSNREQLKQQRFEAWITLRYTIKSNLFIQTIKNNRFGINCGHIFFINRFKLVESILMDVMLVLLFYKKICMH